LSLIELMVSLVLGLFLVGVVAMTYIQTAGGTRFGALESQMNEDGALALNLLRSQLNLAGYSALNADGTRIFRGLPLRGCDGGFTPQTESQAFDTLSCVNDTGSDALAVRYQATLSNAQAIPGPIPTAPEMPGNCANVAMSTTRVNGVDIVLADNRFYIAADTSNGGAPTLYCRGAEPAGMGASAMIPNVERLQIRYAITRLPQVDAVPPHQVTALVDASALPNDQWTRVAAVELCIVMRTARPVPRGDVSAADTASFLDCDGQRNTANTDGRLRRAYRALVPLPNLRPALPSPYRLDNGVAANPYAHLTEGDYSATSASGIDSDGSSAKAVNP